MELIAVLVGFVVALILFLVTREVWCWYWKINEAVAALGRMEAQAKMQTDLLRTIAMEMSSDIAVKAQTELIRTIATDFVRLQSGQRVPGSDAPRPQ